MQDEEATDQALMARYAAGEAAAFGTLYRRHELRVWRYIMRSVGNRASADEIMQEVWFAVAREAHRYRPDARFTTWLFTLARNRVIDDVRARRRSVALETERAEGRPLIEQLATEPGAGPLEAVVVRDQAGALARALRELPQEQRDVFLLHVEADLTVEEAARITGCSFETAKSRLRYARGRLRELLSDYA
jgi:RNA polymerase sigma factor (sigma-70 family)